MPDLVIVERDEPIAVCLLNRPQQLNALSDELMDELVTALRELDADEAIRCLVLGGSERAFAAGADIGELARSSAIELYYARRVERWDTIRNLWTPLVAAVSGHCLGGGWRRGSRKSPSTARSRSRSAPGSKRSGARSTWPSRRRTRARACRPSSRSASRTSPAAEDVSAGMSALSRFLEPPRLRTLAG